MNSLKLENIMSILILVKYSHIMRKTFLRCCVEHFRIDACLRTSSAVLKYEIFSALKVCMINEFFLKYVNRIENNEYQ